jgi:hypothetical protein
VRRFREVFMFLTIRTYRIAEGSAVELGRIAQTEFLRQIETLPGFHEYYLIEAEGDRLASVGTFESRESAEESNRLAAEWVQSRLRGAVQTDAAVTEGRVLVSSRARPRQAAA